MEVRGYIELRTTFTDEAGSRTEKIKYLVVNAPSAYNILLGRPTLNRIGAVPSTRHMKVKLPSMDGVVITIKSDQKEAKKCYENSLKNKRSVSYITTTPPPGVKPRSTAIEATADSDVVMVDAEVGGGERRSGRRGEEPPRGKKRRGNWESPGKPDPNPSRSGSKGRSGERSSSWEDLWRLNSKTRSPK